ncbi:MAG: XRE family transcriptional regulator [Caulobacteraceae bacterium]|jgi:transcriptional regulator with XRE-family HTH domain|nr:XRE family transcriptional regulator [Caulobacteraceae bacterium]
MLTTVSEARTPSPIDVHVGRRVRQRRKAMSITQQQLAAQLGLTFQQVQKYERGTNRVSASKLYEIAVALRTTIAYFFEGLADPSLVQSGKKVDPAAEKRINDFLMSSEGLTLAELFPRLSSARQRRQIVDLVRSMVESRDEAK